MWAGMARIRRAGEAALERELIKRATRGDADAFGELFALYHAPIYAMCHQRLGDTALAEDAVQDTFVRAMRSLHSFDLSRNFFSWLAAIACNRSIDLSQAERGREQMTLDDSQGSVPGRLPPHDVEGSIVDRIRLERALARLPKKSREAVLLHDLAGWTCAEVANSQGTTEHAVRTLLCRSRARLRELLRGLLPVGVIRRVWKELTRNPQASAAEKLAVASCPLFAVSVASFLLVLGGMPGATNRMPPPLHSDSHVTAVRPAARPVFEVSGDPAAREPSRPVATMISWSTTTGAHHPGAIAPSGGTARVEVVGPDGRVLWSHETGFTCEDVGDFGSLTPESSPLQTGC